MTLNRDLPRIAGQALTKNLARLGPRVLPWSEKVLFSANWVSRQVPRLLGREPAWPLYQPDFTQAFQHFCLHAGTQWCLAWCAKCRELGRPLCGPVIRVEPATRVFVFVPLTWST